MIESSVSENHLNDPFNEFGAPMNASREIEALVAGQATQDGAGVRLTRLLSGDLQRRLDPFLMLDAFRSDDPGDYIAGFPEHPHRGFETVTIMLAGRMRHRDSRGNEGLLQAGDVQWMTAGRGILHSEMPEQEDGLMEGFQLWLNLPARDKMCEPGYHDIGAAEIPDLAPAPGVHVRLVAGTLAVDGAASVSGVVQRTGTEPLLMDVRLDAGADWSFSLPAAHNAFLHVYDGEVGVGESGAPAPAGALAVLATRQDMARVRLRAAAPSRALFAAGRPLNEPIAQYGPFVMNTRDELIQAVEDLRAGVLG